LGELRKRRDQLTLRSPLSGEFRVSRAQDLPGRFVKRGDMLGYVVDLSDITARVVVPQTTLDQVRRDTTGVEIRLPGEPDVTITASIRSAVPSVSNQLPNRTLGTQGGGSIAVDARDETGLRSIDPVYQLEIGLPSHYRHRFIGSRVHVRFNHSAEPLAHQWLRSLRQLFLARFEV
jgi:putative peptide zinc metalloprotease protein